MDIATKVKAINAWQNIGQVHPLTCGVNSAHKKLIPEIDEDQIYLRCVDCGYMQMKIPNVIYDWYLTVIDIKEYCKFYHRECFGESCQLNNNHDKIFCNHRLELD